MKVVKKIANWILIIIVLMAIVGAAWSAIAKEPTLYSVIRSNSMYPVWQRGDMVIIENMSRHKEIEKGDIIFFKSEEGNLEGQGWIAHRVLSGNEKDGYITKGDANADTDQALDGVGPIKREWIAGRALTIGGQPIILPKLGYLSLWVEKYQSNSYVLPGFAVLLALIIGIGELKNAKKKQKKKGGLDLPLIYMLGGLTISIVMAATMIISYQRINIIYEVSEENRGVLMGSAVGILKAGQEVEKPLTTLSNNGIIKLIGTLITDDPQISLSDELVGLSKGDIVESEFTVSAEKVGKYNSSIEIGLFYPFLPSSWIYFLAGKSYWLALVVISLIPGLPLMIYPFTERKVRRTVKKKFRQTKRKVLAHLPF